MVYIMYILYYWNLVFLSQRFYSCKLKKNVYKLNILYSFKQTIIFYAYVFVLSTLVYKVYF